MNFSILKNKKQNPKVSKKNLLSITGLGPNIDWIIILIISAVLLIVLFFVSYKQYNFVVGEIEKVTESNSTVNLIDEEKLRKIVEQINSKNKTEQILENNETEEVQTEEAQ